MKFVYLCKIIICKDYALNDKHFGHCNAVRRILYIKMQVHATFVPNRKCVSEERSHSCDAGTSAGHRLRNDKNTEVGGTAHNKIINSSRPLTAVRDACISRLRYAYITASAEYGVNVSRGASERASALRVLSLTSES